MKIPIYKHLLITPDQQVICAPPLSAEDRIKLLDNCYSHIIANGWIYDYDGKTEDAEDGVLISFVRMPQYGPFKSDKEPVKGNR